MQVKGVSDIARDKVLTEHQWRAIELYKMLCEHQWRGIDLYKVLLEHRLQILIYVPITVGIYFTSYFIYLKQLYNIVHK
jgi:hypothetical protein